MGRRHLGGIAILGRSDFANIELAAVCDLHRDNADFLADEAATLLGYRPAVFYDVAEMVRAVDGLDGVSITTDVNAHHRIAERCFANGLHVQTEKPMGLTMRACNAMLAAAAESWRILSVAENYRRDPINRLIRALIDDGAIGTPRQILLIGVGGGDGIMLTPWRHLKNRGGLVLEIAVHFTDLFRYYFGEITAVSGRVRLFEPVRRPASISGPGGYYERWAAQMPETVEATAEDAAYGSIDFANGAVGELIYNGGAFGQAINLRTIHGSRGSIDSPGDRNGRPLSLFLADGTTIADERILEYAPSYRLSPPAAHFFGGERVWTYQLPFNEIDQRLLALEYHEFGDCIQTGYAPEVSGLDGRRAVAAIYAIFESALAGRVVTLDEIESVAIDAYQREIDISMGLI